jgi:hypothetical protein
VATRKVKGTGIHVQGANQLLRTVRAMDKDLVEQVRQGAHTIADKFLAQVKGAASGSAQSQAASGLKVYRDMYPKVGFAAGTAAGVSGGAKLGEFFFGHEFGSNQGPTTSQFPSRSAGNFFYATMRAKGEGYALDWFDLVTSAMSKEWNKGAAAAAAGAP